jgi:hypothetical protein
LRHTEQRAQRFFLQKLDLDISLGRDSSLLAGSLGAFLVSLPLLLGHGVGCVSWTWRLLLSELRSNFFDLELAELLGGDKKALARKRQGAIAGATSA